MSTRILKAFAVAGLCACPAATVQAAFFETTPEPVRLYFSEGESGMMRVGDASSAARPIDPVSAVLLRRNESANIIIADPNPLLFSYTAGKVTTTPTPSFLVIQGITSQFPTSGSGLESAALPGSAAVATGVIEVGGIDIQQFSRDYNALGDAVEQIPSLIDRTLGMDRDQIRAVKDAVNNWNLARLDPSVRGGLSKLDELRRSKAAGQPVDVRFSDTTVQRVNLLSLEGLSRQAKESIQQFLAQVADSQTVLANLDVLREFETAVSGLNQEILLSEIGFNVQANQTANIIVTPVPTFRSLMSETARVYQARLAGDKGKTYAIQIKPYQRFHFSVAPGAVLSFINRTEYTAVDPQGTGTSFEVGVKSDKTGFDEIIPAIAVNITHDRFFGEALEPFVQIGIAPNQGELAFLFGLGMSAYRQFTVSAGAILQEVERLPAGVQLGDKLTEALQVESEFKLGLYVKLSFELQPKRTN